MLHNLYCFAGPSGSGKSTIMDSLAKRCGYTIAESFTDRPPRCPGEKGHHFVTSEEMDRLDLLVPAVFDQHRYGMTRELLDNSDLIVLEPSGVRELQRTYAGKPIRVIGIYADDDTLAGRMQTRGDDQATVSRRIQNDRDIFADMLSYCDIAINNREGCKAQIVSALMAFIVLEELATEAAMERGATI